jgi:predicted NACHT family NTPase
MVDTSRVYIPSKLRFSKNSDLFRAPEYLVRANRQMTLTEIDRSDDSLLVEYKDFRQNFRRVVVLGDPGGGKSTLCQYLCYELSKILLLGEPAKRTERKKDDQLQKVPIRVVLRTFEKARKTEPQLDLFSFICRELKNTTTLTSERIERALKRALEFGHVALAFDGLDEILDTSLRREFVELVVGFCDQFPLCPVCVTSRLVGYEEARLPEVFEEMYLERFDDGEVKEYVEKFLRVVANHTAKESQERAGEFLLQTETNAHDLRQNPLLLGLMAWLFYMKGDVPTNRPEIYRECAILMFERWDQRRGIEAPIPSDFDMLHLFSQLAAKIYGKSGGLSG